MVRRTDWIDEIINSVACPQCGQSRYHMCVYTWPTDVNPAVDRRFLSRTNQVRVARVGMSTKHPHQMRYTAHTAKVRRLRRAEELKHSQPEGATADAIAAWRAQREFDAREFQALKSWLHQFSDILTG